MADKKPSMTPAQAEKQRQADLTRMQARGEKAYLKVSTKPDRKLIDNPYNPAVDPKYRAFEKTAFPPLPPLRAAKKVSAPKKKGKKG